MKLRLRPTLFFVIGIGCTVYQLRSELFPWTLLRSSAQYTNNRRLSLFRSNHLSTVTHRVLKSAAGTLCTADHRGHCVITQNSPIQQRPQSQGVYSIIELIVSSRHYLFSEEQVQPAPAPPMQRPFSYGIEAFSSLLR